MRCYLQEYLALKRLPVMVQDGAAGRLVGMIFREPAWNAVSALVDFGRVMRIDPCCLLCTSDGPPRIRLRSTNGGFVAPNGSGGQLRGGDVDADELLECPVISSRDDAVGGCIQDLLINLEHWRLRYFIVDNGSRRVLLDVSWVTGISTQERCVITDGLPSGALATAPQYGGIALMTPGFEDTIYRHYTRRDFV